MDSIKATDNTIHSNDFDYLKDDFKDNKSFVLFLGAGINLWKGYTMSWDRLMSETFTSALRYCAYENDIPSDIIEDIGGYSNDVDVEIFRNVDVALFKNIDDARLKKYLNTRDHFRSTFSPLVKATIVKQVMGNGYIPTIQQKIYKDCPNGFLIKMFKASYNIDESKNNGKKPFYTLYCLARMILLCDNIKAVVTQNYDTFLSQAVNALLSEPEKFFDKTASKKVQQRIHKKFKIVDISGMDDEQTHNDDCFPVYHVHGYIPDDSQVIPKGGSGSIVLSMDEIYETTRDVFSWQTSTQLHFLSNYACIFAGLSFTDATSQRLLYYVGKSGHKERMYYLDAYYNDIKKESRVAYMKIRNDFLRRYGLTVLYSWKDFEDLYTTLLKNSTEVVIK